jgi:hypothetical protein
MEISPNQEEHIQGTNITNFTCILFTTKKAFHPHHHLCSLRFNFKPPITLRRNTGEKGGLEVLVTKISFKEYRVSQKKKEKPEQNGET